MTGDKRYVYGIVENDDFELEVDGVEGTDRAYTVEHGSIAAVVSDIDTTDPERTTENMEAHDEVLREVMDHEDGYTIVPMRFGMAFKDERTLKNVLDGGERAFKTALDDIEGTVELGIKVVTAQEGIVDADDVIETVRDRLEQVAIDYVENDLFSDRLLLNDAYLVDRDDRVEFDEAVGSLQEDLDDVIVQYTGPFAPYNFVDIQIGARQ